MPLEMNNLPLHNLFLPSIEPSNKLIVILHGRGDSSEGFRFFPQMMDFDDVNFLLLDAPFEYFTGFSWYDLPPNQLPGIEYSKNILTQTFDLLFADRFSPENTILFGFSQGSLLTFEFGSRYQHALAGYIAISGYIFDEHKILEEMNPDVNRGNWLCTHGYEDDVLPFETSESQVNMLQSNGFNIDFRAFHKPHSMDEGEIAQIRIWIEKILTPKV